MAEFTGPLAERLLQLPVQHREALSWFLDQAGSEQPWPAPIQTPAGETLLATRPKGIYKPAWSEYALSVRQSLGGPYPDREPELRSDGTWLFSYFQENELPTERDDEYTNRGMLACWRDGVPVGVMRQVQKNPGSRYKILGLAIIAGWDGGYFFLEGFAPNGLARPRGPAGELEAIAKSEEKQQESAGTFDPIGVIDARERVMAQIVRRRGQPEFRRQLLAAYGGRCAISGCDAIEALEAAHITPFRGKDTNRADNGILLRADLHTLFDLGLLAINASELTVLLAPALAIGAYAILRGKKIQIPGEANLRPSAAALKAHRDWSGL
jgi:putative restriction endonuclease